MSAPIYTATATATGEGRAGGRTATDDGLLDVTLAVPASLGGPGSATNPEQLFAAGWSACFHSALKTVGRQQKTLVKDSSVAADVSLNKTDSGFTLSAALHVHIGGGIDQATAEQLVAAAHSVCPYSVATRGNVPVTLDTTVE